jgi:phosphoesterase RecJ-like protein
MISPRTAMIMRANCSFKDALTMIREAKDILLCTHLMPDGDAFGSMLALNDLCRQLGKRAVMVCHHPVPAYLRFLPGSGDINLPVEIAQKAFDLAISIDASDIERLGDSAAIFLKAGRTLQMDHHQTNTMFAQYNMVLDELPASGSLVFRFFQEAGFAFSRDVAVYLYTAIGTDTGNFCFSNVTDETFEQAAQLMRSGLPLQETARALHLMQEKEQVLLLGRALYSLRFFEDGRLSGMQLSKKDFLECQAGGEHTERIVNHGLYIPGVQMCYLASEQDDGIKFSFRAIAPWEVSRIAFAFDGGGHAQAAGCTIPGPLEDAILRVRKALLEALRQ